MSGQGGPPHPHLRPVREIPPCPVCGQAVEVVSLDANASHVWPCRHKVEVTVYPDRIVLS